MTEPPAPNPLVSVVIPCYRQGHVLAQTVGCVLAQTYHPIEVVVVNDGSDDDTAAVARGFGDRVVYREQANAGPSAARNHGLRTATGQYVLFLDGDDLLHPESVARLVEAAGGRPGAVALMGSRDFTADPEREPAPSVVPPPGYRLLPELFRANHPIHAFLCPRELILKAGGFDERLRAHEDWDLWVRIGLLDAPVRVVPLVGAYYRRTPGTNSGNPVRMARTYAAMLGRLTPLILARTDRLKDWGREFARMVYAARRRLRVWCGPGAEGDAELTSAIRELRRRGARPTGPLPVVIQDRLPPRLGDLFERLGIWLARRVRPRLVEGG